MIMMKRFLKIKFNADDDLSLKFVCDDLRHTNSY